ncbi:MAG: SIMPL domain-containing protein [Alphaproteobacteria bacterium]|nr:SIMPL domain-containing protein [Alphaproteobacteria bacterium]MBN2674873.1 SIMPL domain-containing protein [Alphaproteobacteria bacterium]
MKKTLIWIASVIGMTAVLTLGLEYFTKFNNSNQTIAVSGECLTSAPKDRTAITLHIKTLDKSAAVSMKRASVKAEEITKFLKTQDVEIQTTQFDSYQKTEWDNNLQKSIEIGIETNIALEVSAKKIEIIEVILSKFAGMTDVYSENLRMFTSSETMKPIIEKCLGTAVENARERATVIAKSDGKKVGKMISANFIQTSTEDEIRPMNMLRSTKAESALFSGGLSSKDTDLTVSIGAVFEIK